MNGLVNTLPAVIATACATKAGTQDHFNCVIISTRNNKILGETKSPSRNNIHFRYSVEFQWALLVLNVKTRVRSSPQPQVEAM